MDGRSRIAWPPALLRGEAEPEVEALSPGEPIEGDSLGYLQSIYRDPALPTGVRMRAAIAALSFERPKLAVTAHVDGADFGERLERAIARSARVIAGSADD